jgi:hypothetical protein
VVWTADDRDDEGNPVRDPGSVSYSAAIEICAWDNACKDTPPFALRVERELKRRGFFLARRQVFIGDGAPWIWNLASTIVPEAIQIVDLYHAKEHLSQLASSISGVGTDLARKWATGAMMNRSRGTLMPSHRQSAVREHPMQTSVP